MSEAMTVLSERIKRCTDCGLCRSRTNAVPGDGPETAEVMFIGEGPGFNEDGVVDAIERVTDRYVSLRQDGERFLDTYRRVGFEPFKEAIYG